MQLSEIDWDEGMRKLTFPMPALVKVYKTNGKQALGLEIQGKYTSASTPVELWDILFKEIYGN